MSTGTLYVKTFDNNTGMLKIEKLEKLTGKEALLIRKEIEELTAIRCSSVYIDASNVTVTDLSGINEIIHSNYILAKTNTKLLFAYRQHSVVEKWVSTTGLNRFVETVIVPII
jgi:anti-anti-sigma regulatory factor